LLGPWLNRISAPMNRLALDRLRLAGDDDVLEIGFGGGALLSDLLRATSGRIVGVDLSPAMVSRARRRFRRESRLLLVEGSVEDLPLEDVAVDKACSVNNLYFWPDPAVALSELARVIRPGGTLAICFEPPAELRKWPGHPFGFRLLEAAEVRALMEQAGFTGIEAAEGRGRNPDHFLCLTGTRRAAEAAP
jgi:SAM-dependent methyltransferase